MRRSAAGHRLEYILFRTVEQGVQLLDRGRQRALGRWVGSVWHGLDRGHRAVALDNAGQAFPAWSRGQVEALVRRNFEHLGVTGAEFFGMARLSAADLAAEVRLESLEHLEAARSEGKGVFLLGGHVGNWELAGAAMAAHGFRVWAVGRRLSNPSVDRRITEIREKFGGRMIPHRHAVRPVLKALREGGLVAFLMDQKPLLREAVPSRFFGRPVATNQGLAVLALKTGAPVVPAFDERTKSGHVLRFHPAVPPPGAGDLEGRVRLFTAAFDAAIEAQVRRLPEQWFWVHRRWRLPEGMAA